MSDEATTTAMIPPEIMEFLDSIRQNLEAAEITPLPIQTDGEYQARGEAILYWKGQLATVKARYDELKAPINELAKEIDSQFKPVKDLLEDRIGKFTATLGAYEDMKDLEKASAVEEAEERVDAERTKLQKQITEALERAAHYKGKNKVNLAIRWSQNARDLQIQLDSLVPVPITESSPPKIEGLSSTRRWKGEVTDMVKFANWCVQTDNCHLLTADKKKLNAKAVECGGEKEIPGLQWIHAYTTTRRGK